MVAKNIRNEQLLCCRQVDKRVLSINFLTGQYYFVFGYLSYEINVNVVQKSC